MFTVLRTLFIAWLLVATWSSELVAQSVRVWVNSRSHVYHCPGTRYFQATKSGYLVSETDARAAGHRPAYGRPCGRIESVERASVASIPESRTKTKSSETGEGSIRVWVNTRSHVYHCRGTRYYGNTKNGRYMTQGDARAAGNRPAYGSSCTS